MIAVGRRGLVAALAGLVLGIGFAAGSATVAPLAETCPLPLYAGDVCHLTIDAALRRGLAPVHPLILAASVEAGPDHASQQGLRDVVTFRLLGVPGPTTVALHYDMGAHWGGVVDRGAPELAAWSAGVAMAVAALVTVLLLALGRLVDAAQRRGSR